MKTIDPKTVWSKSEAGRWFAEISDLQGNGLLKGDALKLPSGLYTQFSGFVKETRDGDILQWKRVIQGEEYIIFND